MTGSGEVGLVPAALVKLIDVSEYAQTILRQRLPPTPEARPDLAGVRPRAPRCSSQRSEQAA